MFLLFRRWSSEMFRAKHKQMVAMLKNPLIEDFHRMYRLIDSKSSSLLTHVSLMIAACAFLYADSKGIRQDFFMTEAFAYMLAALILLFCLGLSMHGLWGQVLFFASCPSACPSPPAFCPGRGTVRR